MKVGADEICIIFNLGDIDSDKLSSGFANYTLTNAYGAVYFFGLRSAQKDDKLGFEILFGGNEIFSPADKPFRVNLESRNHNELFAKYVQSSDWIKYFVTCAPDKETLEVIRADPQHSVSPKAKVVELPIGQILEPEPYIPCGEACR